MGPTEGVQRGFRVRRTGAPISVPIGEKTLGPDLRRAGTDHRRRPAARRDRRRAQPHPQGAAVALRAEDAARDAGDGHQGHRPHRPVHPRRQDRHLRRRGCRQDRHRQGAHPQHRHRAQRLLGVRRRRGALPRGHRPVAGDGGVEGPGQDRAGLRPDERAARATGCASG